jgi:hypothetical protein
MSTNRQPDVSPSRDPIGGHFRKNIALYAAIVVSTVAVLLARLVLQGTDRSGAWRIVPVAWVWGVAACSTALAHRSDRPPLAGVVAVALVLRLALVGTAPHLSDDGFRYLWEGLALNHGVDPFVTAPAALSGLDDALRARVNHPDLTSIYPPLALWWFRAVAAWGTDLWRLQLATGLVDVFTAAALWKVAPPRMAWVYALHPLAVLESAAGAHLEPVAIALASAALVDRRLAPLATAAGAWAKALPVAWWWPSIRALGGRGKVVWTAVAVAGALILALPVLEAGPALWRSWTLYATSWEFNGLLYPWLRLAIGGAARPLLAATGVAVVGFTWLRAPSPTTAWLWVGTAFVALTPTAHPWYGLWALVPGIAAGRTGWALAGVSVVGAYGVLASFDAATGAWAEQPWLWWITWVPALAAIALDRRLSPAERTDSDRPVAEREQREERN